MKLYMVVGGKVQVVESVHCSMDPASLDKQAGHIRGYLVPADLAAGAGKEALLKKGSDKGPYVVAVRNRKEEGDHIPAQMDAVVADNRAVVVAEKLGEHYWYHFDVEKWFSEADGFALLMGSSGYSRSYPGN